MTRESATRPVRRKIFLFLFAVGFACLVAHGQTITRGSTNYETPPPVRGSIAWENSQRLARERQEIFRTRIPLPGATGSNVPLARGVYPVGSRSLVTTAHAAVLSRTSSPGNFQKTLFYLVLFLAAGIYAWRKFDPETFTRFNRRYNPLEAGRAFSTDVRGEDESFAQFAAAFRVGPSSSGGPQPENPSQEFYADAARAIGKQRLLLEKLKREADGQSSRQILEDLRAEAETIKSGANFPQALPMWQLAAAQSGLLKQLVERTGSVTASLMRTVTASVELLGELCSLESDPASVPLTEQPLKFLVVDDDLISRHAMSLALNKAFSQPDLAVDGAAALDSVEQTAYDVIFLDVMMPGMDGFELCTKIRNAPLNRTTPIVFVSSQSDFNARAQSAISGGNDLLGKPFLVFEITVKALTLALQKRLHKFAPDAGTAGNARVSSKAKAAVSTSGPSLTAPLPAARRPFVPSTVDGLTEEFLTCAAICAKPLRELCQSLLQCSDEKIRQNKLADAFLGISALISLNHSGISHPSFQLAVALEGLLKKMLQDTKHSTESALGTVVTAADLLDELCSSEIKSDFATEPPVSVLVTDDDLVMRRVIASALQTFFGRPEVAESGEAALEAVAKKSYDVIFMDITMPGMNGFETCANIRKSDLNRSTPVVFVTSLTDFQTHTEMSHNGGNDLMAKPFLTAEINVKALTYTLRGRMERLKTQPVAG